MALVGLEPQGMVLSPYVSTKKLRGGLSPLLLSDSLTLLVWLGTEEEVG